MDLFSGGRYTPWEAKAGAIANRLSEAAIIVLLRVFMSTLLYLDFANSLLISN
jgi:hypothetical protein